MDTTTIISIPKLLTICKNPFKDAIWDDFSLCFDAVKKCIRTNRLEHPQKWLSNDACEKEIHEARVAWLAIHGWDDPIEIDFGCPALGWIWYPLTDGHHRLAAAIMRGDKAIEAVCSGDITEIKKHRSNSKTFFRVRR